MPKIKKGKKLLVFILFLVILALILGTLYFCCDTRIRNIYIYGNNITSDQEIIDMANLTDYPDFFTTLSSTIKKKILKNPYIKNVKVKKSIFLGIHIYVYEYKPLFINNNDNKIVLENGKEINNNSNMVLPELINEVNEEKLQEFIEKYTKIEDKVANKISEIKYEPTEYDKDRFLFYMNDQNYVYITLTKIEYINKYNEMIKKFEGKKGILYLDSGNYFEIKN